MLRISWFNMIRKWFFVFSLLLALTFPAAAGEPIIIPDISSYTVGAAFAGPTRQGFDMAEEEINAAGGVLGRPIKFEHIDDIGDPGAAVTKLEQIILKEKPILFTGCNLATIERAFSAYAKKNKILQISSCTNGDQVVLKDGHDYMFRGAGPLTYGINMGMAERAAQKRKLKWAAINHNYAWGQENLAGFKENLHSYLPQASWVAEHWVTVGKINAGSIVNAVMKSGANAIYTSLWGSDLSQFLREAKKRGLTEKVLIVGEGIGRPYFMKVIKGEMPLGVVTVGILPYEDPVTPKMKAFAQKYQEKYHQSVRYAAMSAYMTATSIVAAIEKAGAVDTEKVAAALKGLKFDSIYGPITVRAIDNVPDNGMWVGETALKNGQPILVNVKYLDGKDYFPSDEYIKKLRAK